MTSKASDILSVSFYKNKPNNYKLLRVVPLFETLDDLINAKSLWKICFHIHGTEI